MTLAELESLAREVHPNGWESCESSLLRDGWTSDFAAYIAALSPERVLAMIAVIEAAKAMRDYAGVMPGAYVFDAALAALDKDRP